MIVLRTLGAQQRRRLQGLRKPREVSSADEPEPVPTTRATLIHAEPFVSQPEADKWLDGLARQKEGLVAEAEEAASQLNVLLRAHRAAAADPYARDVSPQVALVARVGLGAGPGLADGRFERAIEVPRSSRRRRRLDVLAPQERLAALMGAREPLLVGEELMLRARGDLDGERLREAALQARVALEALVAELADDPDAKAGELRRHREPISQAANAALDGELPEEAAVAVEAAVADMERVLARRSVARVGDDSPSPPVRDWRP